ncbi:phosphoribosylaminoimidazolesuccinocarboxamide synthase [Parabacteroides faecis]|uniref:phosphoribosylaminoimidazolesuccinocarboxamide synthase n=1 Tax=Parabacteroides TaxID=375288 RepID=UPI000F00DD5A|nr:MULTISPECIES: phosphoribosylaminoimidazolesuccinocarboxamide synthase [Parabacteroides]MBC8619253.1 phosphoribosylaminoimidazolesuccinocarboxamide synthase [Parabacteroides faecis]RHR91918.1 phosphoribosylaminoimidazolesuccinocarboxamide synthase [Parabacteroides sp. AF14-59]
MSKKFQIKNSTAEFLIFTNQAKENGIEVRVQNETIWLSQKLMAVLFNCSTDNISLHLKNIFNDGELDPDSVTEEFSVTASDGKNSSTISAQVAKAFAETEFKKYRIIQDQLFKSDFDSFNDNNLLNFNLDP